MWFLNSEVLSGWTPLLAKFYLDNIETVGRGRRKEGGGGMVQGGSGFDCRVYILATVSPIVIVLNPSILPFCSR